MNHLGFFSQLVLRRTRSNLIFPLILVYQKKRNFRRKFLIRKDSIKSLGLNIPKGFWISQAFSLEGIGEKGCAFIINAPS